MKYPPGPYPANHCGRSGSCARTERARRRSSAEGVPAEDARGNAYTCGEEPGEVGRIVVPDLPGDAGHGQVSGGQQTLRPLHPRPDHQLVDGQRGRFADVAAKLIGRDPGRACSLGDRCPAEGEVTSSSTAVKERASSGGSVAAAARPIKA